MIDGDYGIIAGHGRVDGAKQLGMTEVPCIFVEDLTETQKRAYILADNKLAEDAGWDDAILRVELEALKDLDFEISLTGFDLDFDFGQTDGEENQAEEQPKNKLTDIYGIPPFSVIDGRKGEFLNNNKAWKELGIRSEIGRDDNLIHAGKMIDGVKSSFEYIAPSTSIFAPFLCELMYKWFCVKGGNIFDCFAGGSVRGIVADKLNYNYTGIELRQEQVNANIDNANELCLSPKWICDDSRNMDEYIEDGTQDMLFSCPPYADLEVYSDDENDLSNMEYGECLRAYEKIIRLSYNKLKDDSFAVFVVGEARDKNGNYYNFVGDTIQAFLKAGFVYYNEIIYITPAGTNCLRAHQFNKSRKVVKGHQNILVFFKGDTKNIKNKFLPINFNEDIFDNNGEDEICDLI